ncbi:MAG TPA: hypothetical protein VNZ25_06525 [Candidatus Angelobacter sp.]|nr:hypothetical protein [Candidatus Angelobacter sp.]
MKTTSKFKSLGAIILGAAIVLGGLLFVSFATPQTGSLLLVKDPVVAAQLKSFVAEKEAQAYAVTNPIPAEFKSFFHAAEKGDWLAVSNDFAEFRQHAGQYDHSDKIDPRLRGTAWQAVMETWGALAAFGEGEAQYSAEFGTNIVASIPPGSIYFGGTDPGRFLVTAFCKSQVNGDPFFVLTQNALADVTYLQYLQGMYGRKIYTPTIEDSQKCFQDYTQDVAARQKKNQLKPGEDINVDANGKIQISGQVDVMEINGLLAKIVFDKNPDRDFYVEESFPLDWMYPYLEPHGLIFKINRQPLTELSNDIVTQDHDYWSGVVRPMIGDWLTDDTTVEQVAAFVKKTFAQQDFSGFTGDKVFIQNEYSNKTFSKLRSAIAGLYAWRIYHAVGDQDKKRMAVAADFAFRQAWALCPNSPEAVFRYVNFLLQQNRISDAILVVEATAQMPSMQGQEGDQVRATVQQLKAFQKSKH